MSVFTNHTDSFSAQIKGADNVVTYMKKNAAARDRAFNTALRVEGIRLKNKLQSEIRRGAPGGRRFAPLSFIAKRAVRKVQINGRDHIWQNPNRRPLERLAHGIRYDVNPRPPYAVAVGFVGPMTWTDADLGLGYVGRRKNQYSPALVRDPSLNPLERGISRAGITSKKWRWLGKMHQEGFSRKISEKQRTWFKRRGAELAGWSKKGGKTLYSKGYAGKMEAMDQSGNKPFFLRTVTRTMTTPGRPIIEPFWDANRADAVRNIRSNFVKKLAGRRI